MPSKRSLLTVLVGVLACCVLLGCAATPNHMQLSSLGHQFDPDHVYHVPSIQIHIAPEFQIAPEMPILPDLPDLPGDVQQFNQPQQNIKPRVIPVIYHVDRGGRESLSEDPRMITASYTAERDHVAQSGPVRLLTAGHRSYSRNSCTTNTTGQRQTLRYRLRVRSISRGGTCCNI